MTAERMYLVLAVFTGLYLALPAFPQNSPEAKEDKEETYPVRIILEARPDAKFYQVEWLENDEINGQADAPAGQSRREKVTRTEIKTDLPVRFKFFRLRSAYREDLFGPWGQVVEIPRHHKPLAKNDKDKPQKMTPEEEKKLKIREVFAQVIDKDGKEKWVLRGNSVAADKLESANPLYYDVECLSEKDAPENTNGRKKYESPVQFMRAGQYKMNLYNTDDMTKTEPLRTIIFWVYTDVPRTYAKFYAPFLHGKGGFTVGGKTKIALIPQIGGAAIDKIEYRIYADGEKPGTWQKYLDEIEVDSFAKGKYGFYNVEYQATNVAGAVEPPELRRMLIDAHAPVVENVPADGGKTRLNITDENFPIVIRIYQGGKLIEDKYFKMWSARDSLQLPAGQGLEIRVIDLLGNETVIRK